MKLRKKASFWFLKLPKVKLPKVGLPNFKKPKISIKFVLITALVLVVIGGGTVFYRNYTAVTPEEAVNTALSKTLNADSYRYQAVSKKIIDSKEELLSEVKGEKGSGNVHFNGKLHVVNSDFEIYQIGEKLYRKDTFSQDWLVVEDVNVEATEKLMQEINPLGVFVFSQPIAAQYVGKEKVGDKKCKKYEVMAETENKYLQVLWQDFTYTVWVDKEGFLSKAKINAVNKYHENQRLVMDVEFSDYNREIVINPPE